MISSPRLRQPGSGMVTASAMHGSVMWRSIVAVVIVAGACQVTWAEDGEIDFNRDIRPILSDVCFTCHGPDANTREAELRLDLEDSLFAKRDEPLIVRGNAEASVLYQRLMTDDGELRMPPPSSRKQLTAAQKDLFKRWIAEGARWATHWSYVAPQKFEPPQAVQDGFTLNAIDQFILDRLRKEKLAPSPVADDVTAVRRLYFDLLGLPPRPEDVARYINSADPQKYEKLVDELLSSEHFGERLAIYWLDVVRYADSNGYHSDEPRQVAPYRDYVIAAFNNNKPYDQFVIEQLAGDLLPEAGQEQQIASGFNMLLQTTSEGGAQPKEYLAKYMADRVRNTSQIFLGSTMGCCECHNHKYDPFTMADFYSMGAFFADMQERAVGNPATFPVMTPEAENELASINGRLTDLRQIAGSQTPELDAALAKWEASIQGELDSAADFGPWHMIGPFGAASFDEAFDRDFVPAAEVDLKKKVSGQAWKASPQFADGQLHNLSGDNSATYLYRTVNVSSATKLALSLGSDDSLTVWLNGQQILNNRVQRAVAADQDRIDVELKAGENHLLMKVCNGTGGYGFYFKANSIGLPPAIVTILKTAPDQRSDAQKKELANHYRSTCEELKPVRDEIASLEKRQADVNAALPRTLMTKTMAPRPIRLLPRGNWLDESGPEMQPAVPGFLGELGVEGRRADRLDLAKWIVRRENPLTARTFVNRLWKLYFGHGLAAPLDDLGRQGTVPTHPKLLDWLAVEFMDSHWDIKHMVRLIVTSGTYRQQSLTSPELARRDPYNMLYARQTRFRHDAEVVRDNALAISGLLVNQVGGRSVYPYQPAGYWRHMNFPAREWPGDQGESLYRRGLYTWWQRMFLHPAMVAFDAPSREECTVERPRSNIPQQALVLLNDPAFVEAARSFGARIMTEGGSDTDSRIKWAFQNALSRDPSAAEANVMRRVFDKHLAEYQADEAAARQLIGVGASKMPESMNVTELAAWSSVGRVILNLAETMTRR